MQITATDRQGFIAALQVDGGGVVVGANHLTNRAQVDHDRAMHLYKALAVQLFKKLPERRTNQCIAGVAGFVAPGDPRVFSSDRR